MLEGSFGQADVASTPQASGAHGVRDRAFNASPSGIGVLKGRGVLRAAALLDGLMLCLRAEGEMARGGRRAGTTAAERTGGTLGGCEPDVNDGIALLVMGL